MNYFPQSQTCEIHENVAAPRGSGHLIRNDEVIYTEKFCQPSTIITYSYVIVLTIIIFAAGINAAHKCNPDDLHLMHVGQRIKNHELDANTNQATVDDCLAVCLANAACKVCINRFLLAALMTLLCKFHLNFLYYYSQHPSIL